MNNKREILLIAFAVVAALGVVFAVARRHSEPNVPGYSPGAPENNAAVPDPDSANLPSNVAKPQAVAPAGPGGDAKLRSFAISAKGNQFSPNTVIVKVGDTVHLAVAAMDKDYDFTQPDYGFRIPLPKGKAIPIEFQATAAGKFTFYCKSCGGPSKGPVGYLIVAAK